MTTASLIEDELRQVLDRLPEDADGRQAFAALGDAGLFAVHYPPELGGRGAGLDAYAAVAEAIGDRELADEVHLVTVQGVGCTILRYGTEEQRARWLPGIASGRTLASLLLSEQSAGSDAAAITTSAHRTVDGWVLNGTKSWSLHTDWSCFGLCSARTSTASSRYAGITLFVVDLARDGVRVEPAPRLVGKPYFTVTFEDVALSDDEILGEADKGFPLITAAAGFERVGLDYLTRGRVWLRAAEEALEELPQLADSRRDAMLARLDYELRSARALAFATVASADGLEFDYIRSAYSKYACGEAAQAVARWIGEDLLPVPEVRTRAGLTQRLEAAVHEGPELSISGNAVDLLLDTISLDPALGEL